jgi:putative NADH-flavin reductase
MKSIFVIGATGGTGQEVVRQALDRGHAVTALVRDRTRLPVQHSRLTVMEGNVLERNQLVAAMAGADAVLFALGVPGRPKGPVDLYSSAGKATLDAMQATGLNRIAVVTAGAYVRSPQSPMMFRLIVQPIILSLLRESYADMMRLEKLLASSKTLWTVVRPARLHNGPKRPIRTAVDDAVPRSWLVSRASVAGFMLDCVSDGSHVGERVSIAE